MFEQFVPKLKIGERLMSRVLLPPMTNIALPSASNQLDEPWSLNRGCIRGATLNSSGGVGS